MTEIPAALRDGQPGAGPTWAADVTSSIGREIKYWRARRRLSGEQLAKRTSDLGFPIPRNVIANLENRRRDSIGVAELLVLAAALDVPPVQLVAPVGRRHPVEILPHVRTSAWKARGWIHGATQPEYQAWSVASWQDSRRAITLYDIHRLLVREHEQLERRIARLAEHDPLNPATPAEASEVFSRLVSDAVKEYSYSLDRLRSHRAQIEAEGFALPDLPPAIADALHETRAGGRHRPASDRIDDRVEELKVYGATQAALRHDPLTDIHRQRDAGPDI